MKTPYFIENIDWTNLRTQKASLLSAITKAEETGNNEFVDDLNGILALIDALQDFAVDVMDVPEMHVFDFELEDERSGMVAPEFPDEKTKSLYLCSNCGSNNVEMRMWMNVNKKHEGDNTKGDNIEVEDCYCNDCEGNHELLLHELKSDAKVIGFQVVGEEHSPVESELHPYMDASICIYNLSQAREMLNTEGNWGLITIWEGDIEQPTYMFSGDPRA